jgi:DNA repair ATPase RecN
MSQHTDTKPATVAVENVGGIDACEIEIEPGVTVFTGQNATNRTSLLTAIAGTLGGTAATLKSDTDEGYVQLEYNDDTYTRRYHRQPDGTVRTEGNPYTDESELVDLFACLLEDNPARQAVEQNGDLREILMRPVDTERIQEQIREFERERRQVTSRLEEIERERDRLPTLESRRVALEDELETVTAKLETLREQVADYDVDADTAEEAEALLDELDSRRQSLAQTRDEIETQQSTLEALREERKEAMAELDDLNGSGANREHLEQELDGLQERESELRDSINDLSAIVEFNDELLNSSDELVDTNPDEQTVTDELNPMSATIKCWTCGNRVERRAIDSQLEELRTVIEEKRSERQEVQDEIAALREQLDQLQSAERRRRECEERLDEIDRQRQRREQRVNDLEKKVTDLRETIRDLEEEVKETEEFRESELVEQYERLSELEYERGQIEQELNDVEDELRELESLADEREQLEAQKAQLQEELESLRTRIEDLERDAVKAFNEHMAEVLSLLEYQNIERIWIERKVPNDGPEGVFELHVVRATENGTMYEDTVDHLSESEREVIGLVVALAGYLVHEVYETVPVMLLDSLEAIDAGRIARLIEYVAEFASYLIVALLEEDAQGLNDTYTRLSSDAIGP